MSEEPLEEPIEDLPIFDDVAPESSPSAWHEAGSDRPGTSEPAMSEGDDASNPINLADYSRSPARPRRTPAPAPLAPIPAPAPGLSWVDRGVQEISRRGGDRGAKSGADRLDWALVTAFRVQTSNRLSSWTQANPGSTEEEQRREGRLIIEDLLESTAREDMIGARATWTVESQARMAEAVYNAVFGLGRLQPFIDDDDIENIEIRGNAPAMVERVGGIIEYREPVADNDDELIGFLSFLGARNGGVGRTANEREFSSAQPRLHLRLEGGARLAATAWVTPSPIVVIRRHRLISVDLDDLVAREEFGPLPASFMRAAVRAEKSFCISGAQGAGKTTMLRALCAEIPPDEHIGTFETEYELYLHEMHERHTRVDPFEARPGTGEAGLGGRRAGEVTIDDCLVDSYRFNEKRQIVGEVRGREILAMIKAMQSGTGSMSTTHARNARAAISKLVTCALEAGSHISERYAERAIAEGIDLLVHINLETIPTDDGRYRRVRRVSEIVAVEWSGDGVSFTDVFKQDATGELRPHVLPDQYRDLERFGFRLDDFLAAGGNYPDQSRP